MTIKNEITSEPVSGEKEPKRTSSPEALGKRNGRMKEGRKLDQISQLKPKCKKGPLGPSLAKAQVGAKKEEDGLKMKKEEKRL
jgi:hypothetical protein